jgi:hypothetical protein
VALVALASLFHMERTLYCQTCLRWPAPILCGCSLGARRSSSGMRECHMTLEHGSAQYSCMRKMYTEFTTIPQRGRNLRQCP